MNSYDFALLLIPVLIGGLSNLRTRTEWKAMIASGALLAALCTLIVAAPFGVTGIAEAFPGLLFVFGVGCFVGGLVAIPFKLWRQHNGNGPPPAEGAVAQSNNAFERPVGKRGAPLRRELPMWPAAQLNR